MEYKDFISKLYIKGAGSQKAELTRDLFLSAVNDTSVITDKRDSISVYKGYNRGNPINEIADDVINNLKQSGIEPCIEEYLNKMHGKKSENVQKICCKLKEYIPDITPENICNRIAVFFIDEVLRPAAKEYEKTISSTKDNSTRNDPASVQEAKNVENGIDGYSEDNNVNITNKNINNITETNSLSDINAADKEKMKKITQKIIHSFDKMKHVLEEECDYIAESKKNKSNEDEIKEGLKEYEIQLAEQFISFNMLNLKLISFRKIYPDRGSGPLFELANIFCKFELDALTCTLSKTNEYHFSDIMNKYESALVGFRDFIFNN